jgi:hypothetical protein
VGEVAQSAGGGSSYLVITGKICYNNKILQQMVLCLKQSYFIPVKNVRAEYLRGTHKSQEKALELVFVVAVGLC